MPATLAPPRMLKVLRRADDAIVAGAWTILLQIGSKLFVAATLAAAVGRLSVVEFGRFSLALALGILASVLLDAGFTPSIERFVAIHGTSRQALGARSAVERLLWSCVVAGVLFSYMRFRSPLDADTRYLVLVYGASLLGAQISLSIGFGLLDFRRASTIYALTRVVGCVAVGAQVLAGWVSVEAFLLVQILVEVGSAGALYLAQARRARGHPSGALDPRPPITLARSFPYAITAAVNVAVNRSDAIVVSRFVSLAALSYYAFASQVQTAVSGLSLTLSAATLAYVTKALHAGDHRRATQLIRRAAATVVVLSLALSLVTAIVLVTATHSFLPKYSGSDGALLLLMAGAFLSPVAAVYFSYFAAQGRPGRTTSCWLASGIAFVVVLAVLPRDASYAALAACVRDAVLLIAALTIYRRVSRA